MDIPNKQCSKCNLLKPMHEFHRNNRTYDRLSGRCKECVKKYKRPGELNRLRGYMKCNFNENGMF